MGDPSSQSQKRSTGSWVPGKRNCHHPPHQKSTPQKRQRIISSTSETEEVDRFSDLADLLQQDGFRGVYKARTGEAHDGCAIFWKEELFSLLHQDDIEFRKFGLRDNVAQFCVLKVKIVQIRTTTRTLLVGNIHVLFNPNRGDIKLGQIRLFVEKADAISQEWGSIPVVLAGDLNSMPQVVSCNFVIHGKLDILLHDRRKLSGQIKSSPRWKTFRSPIQDANSLRMTISRPLRYGWSKEELQNAAGSGGATHLQHRLKLCSAYVGVPGTSSTRDRYGEPLATSYHSKFLGTVDYLWHSKELLPVGVLETLPVNILSETGGLPSEAVGPQCK
ncbi:Endonuclease/exonuclease/phosphatase [Macleaya cordata]|uniref:Endonuclease/exonuclease/phosphatase n=1 Tax=Macleaya cordata TaxID=56857 RepID=A0A200Q3G4_MACCD|nr:Endonuclease/exonuclease/phosphatase [Macleaya cordata]